MKNLLFGAALLAACGSNAISAPGLDGSQSGTGDAASGSGGIQGSGGTAGAEAVDGSAGTTATGGNAGSAGGPVGSGGMVGGITGSAGRIAGSGGSGAGGRAGGGGQASSGGAGRAGSTGTGGQVIAGSTGTAGARTGGAIGAGGATAKAGAGGSAAGWSAGPAESKPWGYGQGTTGGGSASATDVASMAAMQAAIDAYSGSGGLVLRYTGRFDFSSIADPCSQHGLAAQILEIKKKNDISIIGADGSAANFGIHIASSSSNIIIRNMTFGLLPGGDASDAISIEGMSGGTPTNLWIDHNELFSALVECAGAGDTSFDGLIDLKKGADKVTVSYNYVHDHAKVSLNGFSDNDTEVRHITFHHNIFENVSSRTPLQRGGYSHLVSNYFHRVTTSGANIRMNGYALIEANYFDTVKNPVTSRDSDAIGFWELRNNNIASPADFATYGITWSASDSTPTADATDWKTSAAFPVALGYSYSADMPACVKAGLPSVAGAGKDLATLRCN